MGHLVANAQLCSLLVTAFLAAGCGDASFRQKSRWDSLDYSSIARKRGEDNDSRYVIPRSYSCVDDDLYNCR